MTKREIFFIVSLACLGIFILFGSYLWKENAVYSQEMEYSKGTYTKQAAEPQKKTIDSQATSSNPVSNTTNPAAAVAPTVATPPGNVQAQQSNPAPPVALQSFITSGSKVGDIVKLGDLEMIVTKATARHKVIDITLKGNTPEQPPRLVLAENNRIVYEIPADVDVNMDVTEKVTIEKSPLFYGEQKAGK